MENFRVRADRAEDRIPAAKRIKLEPGHVKLEPGHVKVKLEPGHVKLEQATTDPAHAELMANKRFTCPPCRTVWETFQAQPRADRSEGSPVFAEISPGVSVGDEPRSWPPSHGPRPWRKAMALRTEAPSHGRRPEALLALGNTTLLK